MARTKQTARKAVVVKKPMPSMKSIMDSKKRGNDPKPVKKFAFVSLEGVPVGNNQERKRKMKLQRERERLEAERRLNDLPVVSSSDEDSESDCEPELKKITEEVAKASRTPHPNPQPFKPIVSSPPPSSPPSHNPYFELGDVYLNYVSRVGPYNYCPTSPALTPTK